MRLWTRKSFFDWIEVAVIESWDLLSGEYENSIEQPLYMSKSLSERVEISVDLRVKLSFSFQLKILNHLLLVEDLVIFPLKSLFLLL